MDFGSYNFDNLDGNYSDCWHGMKVWNLYKIGIENVDLGMLRRSVFDILWHLLECFPKSQQLHSAA